MHISQVCECYEWSFSVRILTRFSLSFLVGYAPTFSMYDKQPWIGSISSASLRR
jgi:hypothetical protein